MFGRQGNNSQQSRLFSMKTSPQTDNLLPVGIKYNTIIRYDFLTKRNISIAKTTKTEEQNKTTSSLNGLTNLT